METTFTIDGTPAESFDALYCVDELRQLHHKVAQARFDQSNATEATYSVEDLREIYIAAVKLEIRERAKEPSVCYIARNALKAAFDAHYGWQYAFNRTMFHVIQDATNILNYIASGQSHKCGSWIYYVITHTK
jgi:hypothetical protein